MEMPATEIKVETKVTMEGLDGLSVPLPFALISPRACRHSKCRMAHKPHSEWLDQGSRVGRCTNIYIRVGH